MRIHTDMVKCAPANAPWWRRKYSTRTARTMPVILLQSERASDQADASAEADMLCPAPAIQFLAGDTLPTHA